MGLLIVGEIVAVGIALYFVYCEIHASVFQRLGFTDNENVKFNNVEFQKFYPKKVN